MLSATFGDEIIGYEQGDSTGCDIDHRVRFLGSGSGLLGLNISSHLRELTLRRLLSAGRGLLLLRSLVEQAADTDLDQAWKKRSGNLADTPNDAGKTSKNAVEKAANILYPIRIAVGRDELIPERACGSVVRCTKTVGDVLDVSHCSDSDQTVPISGSRHILCTWVNEN